MEGTWNKVTGSPQEPGLFGQTTVEYKGALYCFGGCDRAGTFYNTMSCYNISMYPHLASLMPSI